VQELISSYSATETLFSAFPCGFFPENMGAISDEHCDWFHQDISQIEKKYGRRWSPSMLADYFWSLVRETVSGKNKKPEKMK
jgi:hypothetical protein